MRLVFLYDSDDGDGRDDVNIAHGGSAAVDRSKGRQKRRRRTVQHRMDVDEQQTVGEIKETVRRNLRLPGDESSASSESHDRQVDFTSRSILEQDFHSVLRSPRPFICSSSLN